MVRASGSRGGACPLFIACIAAVKKTAAATPEANTIAPPSCVGMLISTGIAAPTTQITWNRDSKRAKVRPRFASGASRWTTASNACFPEDAATATPNASSD